MEKVFAPDDVHGEAVSWAPDLHWMKSGFWGAPEAQKPFAGQTACDVEAHGACEVGPEDASDNFGRGGFSNLVRFSRAIMIEANDALGERAGD